MLHVFEIEGGPTRCVHFDKLAFFIEKNILQFFSLACRTDMYVLCGLHFFLVRLRFFEHSSIVDNVLNWRLVTVVTRALKFVMCRPMLLGTTGDEPASWKVTMEVEKTISMSSPQCRVEFSSH